MAEVPPGTAIGFRTPAAEGYIVNRNGEFAAVSGVCTHLGRRLLLNRQAATFDCACHRAAFNFDGAVLYQAFPQRIAPLPLISTRVSAGNVEVLVWARAPAAIPFSNGLRGDEVCPVGAEVGLLPASARWSQDQRTPAGCMAPGAT